MPCGLALSLSQLRLMQDGFVLNRQQHNAGEKALCPTGPSPAWISEALGGLPGNCQGSLS